MIAPRRIVAMIAAATYGLALPAEAVTLAEIFDGVNSNASSAGSFQGQTMNVYTGGSFFMRAPRKTYNLLSATAPTVSSGCGGIDLFAGAFSYVNKEQFVAMLRNIGQNAVGYAFKLAIQNLCAPCDNVMQALEETARAMNSMNINSCEAAQGVVNAALPDLKKKSDVTLAKTFGPAMNKYDDALAAWAKVFPDDAQRRQDLSDAKAAIPGAADQIPSGNITWKALKKLPGLDDDVRETLMSLVGTTIFSDDPTRSPELKDGTGITVETLVGKPGETNTPLTIWRCSDNRNEDGCRTLTTVTTTSQRSLLDMVRGKMMIISSKMATRSAYDTTELQDTIKFVNVTEFPIYKLLAVTSSLNNVGIAAAMINKYGELVAAKYAEAYLRAAADEIRAALNRQATVGDAAQTAAIDRVRARLAEVLDEARKEVAQAYRATSASFDMGVELATYERAMNSSLPRSLRNSLAFQRSAGGF